jgi:hypothetical protein
LVFTVVFIPIGIAAARHGSSGFLVLQLVALTIGSIGSVLVSPIGAIALCLLYFDERVRREGFDIVLLMHRAAPAEETAAEPLVGREPAQ